MKKKIRPLGKISDDIEPLLEEMVDDHEMQAQEIIANVLSWLQAHRPECFPIYDDGSILVVTMEPKK
jgi:hypothetical protein